MKGPGKAAVGGGPRRRAADRRRDRPVRGPSPGATGPSAGRGHFLEPRRSACSAGGGAPVRSRDSIASLQDRLRGVAAGLARLRDARARVRDAGARDGRPELVPEGRGRPRESLRLQRRGQRRRASWDSGRSPSRGTTSTAALAHGRAAEATEPVRRRRLRRDRRRAARARPVRRGVRRVPDDGRHAGPISPRTRGSRTRASSSATSAGAVDAMRMAFEAAGTPTDAAWAAYQLGELELGPR